MRINKIKYISTLFAIICSLCIFIPSISYAAKNEIAFACNKDGIFEGGTGDGTEENPIEFSTDYTEITFVFEEYAKLKYPFYFKINKGSNGVIAGQYIVDVDTTNLKVKFTLVAGNTAGMEPFSVGAGTLRDADSYIQAGAKFNPNSTKTKFFAPTYKIVAYEYKGSTARNPITLGNTYIGFDLLSGNIAPYSTAYVFSTTNVLASSAYHPAEGQSVPIFSETSWINIIGSAVAGAVTGTGAPSAYQVADGNIGVTYAFHGPSSDVLDDNENSTIERIVAKILTAIGDVFMDILYNVAGSSLSIDALIFNEYKPTIVDFFNNNGLYTGVFKSIINSWFKAFSTISQTVLMIILVAVGVKSMIHAGSGNQRKISTMVVGWILAIVILFFGPYGMKYAIEINDALVRILRDESKYSIFSVYNSELLGKYQLGEDSTTVSTEDLIALQSKVSGDVDSLSKEVDRYKNQATNQIKEINTLWNRYTAQTFGQKIEPIFYYNGEYVGTDVRHLTSRIDSMVQNGESFNPAHITVGNEHAHINENQQTSNFNRDLQRALGTYYNVYQDYNAKKIELAELTRAVNASQSNVDLMGIMRAKAGETYRLLYVVIWGTLILQLVLLLFLYYKRLIVVAYLIIIFPLVAMSYAFEKLMGIEKPQTMKTWVQEYVVNVFIQSIHALLYLTLVETGLQIFEKDADNWLLFVFAVMAIFPMEALMKSILGVKGSTMSDLTKGVGRTVAYAGAAASIMSARGKYKDMDQRYENSQVKANQKFEKAEKKLKTKMLEANNKANLLPAAQRANAQRQNQNTYNQNRAKLREKYEARNKRRANLRKIGKDVQLARNVASKIDAFTTGLAGGGDPEDFVAGAAISGMLAGANRTVKDKTGGRSSKPIPTPTPRTSNRTAGATRGGNGTQRTANGAARGNRYANNSQGGTTQTGNRAATMAQNAAQAAQANGGNAQNTQNTAGAPNAGSAQTTSPQMTAEQIEMHEMITAAYMNNLTSRSSVNVHNNKNVNVHEQE